jgi:hypothetical protein
VLRRYPDLRIEIAGHTDAVGADAVNQQLSEARAEGAGCRRLRDLLGRLLASLRLS